MDPLVIDLDGDGVELTAILAADVHFDWDGDGFAERTGWVHADDGILVLDRNGNGTIDAGTELFGHATLDGFDALRELDSNQDGKFDALDAQFGDVRVWQDANGDGVSQASELHALNSLGIVSISLDARAVSQERSGNWVARSGEVILADGSVRTAESVYFTVDNRATQYVIPEEFEYHDLAAILPDLKGFGTVRDLSVAISQDALLLDSLVSLVIDSNGMSAQELRGRVESLVYDWVGVGAAQPGNRGIHVDYTKLAIVEAFQGEPFWEELISAGHAQLVASRYESIIDGLMGRLVVQIGFSYFALGILAEQDVDFLGHSLAAYGVLFYDAETDTIDGRPDLLLALLTGSLDGSAWDQLLEFEKLLEFLPPVSGVLFNGDRIGLGAELARLLNSETNFSDLTLVSARIAIEHKVLIGTEGDDVILGDAGGTALDGGAGNDILRGGAGNDIYVFGLGYGHDVAADSISLTNQGGFDIVMFGVGITVGGITVTQGDNGRDLIVGVNGTSDQLTLDEVAVDGWKRIEEFRFADGTTLSFAELFALATTPTAGNDSFFGTDLGDSLAGGEGDDTLVGRAGDDRLEGGAGNDLLKGGGGDDTYVFHPGFGQDVVSDSNGLTDQGGFDTIEFGDGISAADISVVQADGGRDLVIRINGTADQVTLDETAADGWKLIEQVRFADGTVLTHADLMALATAPTAGDDLFYGSTVNDVLAGAAGNDTLIGKAGNDRLEGGTDNDLLKGGGGDDTYVFHPGFGQDVISDSNGLTDQGGFDTIEFGAGISVGDISVVQADAGKDLVIRINGSTDQITLDNVSSDGWARIEQVRFADGTILTHNQLLEMATGATSGNDTISGDSGHNNLYGGGGNDVLLGNAGNDRLDGGPGNDLMRGGSGNDTYVFERGSGQDVILDPISLTNRGGYEVVLLGADIALADISVVQADNGNDLVIRINGTTDQLTLDNTASDGYATIEEVRFADGTVLYHADLMALATAPTPGNDLFYGSVWNDTLLGGGGNDVLIARAGNDTLVGGAGNDYLQGGGGDDSFLFDLGFGQDVIYDPIGFDQGGYDRVIFGLGITPADICVTQGDGGNDLILKMTGTADQVTLDNTVNNGYARIEEVRFADGTVWAHADLVAFALAPKPSGDNYWGDAGANTLSGGDGDDLIYGRAGDDVLSGDSGDDSLFGEDGNDLLLGGSGDDILVGGNGNDVLDGGVGADRLTGGAGMDVFRFGAGETGLGTAADRIVDFTAGQDRIDLSAIDADSTLSGDQAFTFIGGGAFSGTAGEVRVASVGTDTWIEADLDGDGAANFTILLTGQPVLAAADFVF